MKSKRCSPLIWAFIMVAVIGICVAVASSKANADRIADVAAKREALSRWVESFGGMIEENVSEEWDAFPYFNRARIDADAKMNYDNYYKWYKVDEHITVTVYAKDSFDRLSDRTIYNWLRQEAIFYGSAIDIARRYHLQEYEELIRFFQLPDEEKGVEKEDIVFRSKAINYIIKTTKNTYERAANVQDYYVLNDKDHFIRDEKSVWTAPTPTPTPIPTPKAYAYSGSGNSSGSSPGSGKKHIYTDPADYDDPEEYADDAWGVDFDDWDDAYDYWEDY